MLILAIDTSATASAALVSGDGLSGDSLSGDGAAGSKVVGSFATEDTRSHAEVLAPGIQELLASTGTRAADIDAVVTGVGPGPFTGLRSGIATARTLAFVWNKPLYGVVSLDAIALDVAESAHKVPEFLVVTDARRKEVYWARYSMDDGGVPRLADGPHVGAAESLPALPAFGAGAGLYSDALAAHPAFRDRQPDAASLGRRAVAALAAGLPLPDSTPLYLRESDAQVPGPRKRAL
ncbi:tRNA (adenosine(37)-N6)-threonylcarbamoyltransferase complex dimerization subunit type 1 TsaB [Pseudarthrobacter sp. J75]|uniref:tRNA (adenosine(37)-N6)-threonylcarbamoyltransferase complex dimerization subunit type 1 TsaB n=1 Tax=unclassified Pseudarthrobacter TaxID=2647000 RepID=UPI002E803596|nr:MULTISPECIES: tRNA (adenosine(37)-N6)-threonylcarbamoyltransferase complex dimerization subunit type 1 TsaB [unclassified Pseudarthrobacter]MEE2521216.1 tRNA (adenosine(37)-N6)-threonylcarbamoyltransferase complex dimerization subunit type 1 TsaB [Pseudarthrobacter sp. J47]MEE2528448.1 tRNA (adenosine(37)-N6)-threonylcarbamoyltransferase complex dimerization subunit type 1 TsaB [Pseudarthrobacter sp. J75]